MDENILDELQYPTTPEEAITVATTPPPGAEPTFGAGIDPGATVASLMDADSWKAFFDGVKRATAIARKLEPVADVFLPSIAAQVLHQILNAIPLPGTPQN